MLLGNPSSLIHCFCAPVHTKYRAVHTPKGFDKSQLLICFGNFHSVPEKHLNLICIWTRFYLQYLARGALPAAYGTVTELSTLSYFHGDVNLCPTTNLLPLVPLETVVTRGLHEITSPSFPSPLLFPSLSSPRFCSFAFFLSHAAGLLSVA